MRVRKLLIVFAAFALLVAACGDDDEATTTEATEAPTTTTAAPTTTEAAGLQTLESGVLTVGSDISWPPFEEYNEAGEVVGFDADLVNEIGSRLGLTVLWQDTSFDTIFTNLAQGQFDIVASGATITAERAQQVNFSDGYFNSNQALTVNLDETPDIASLADLSAGDSVAVQTGTTGAVWATENLAPLGIDVREFPQAPDTYNALEGGQVTGVIFDIDSALEEVDNREGLAVVAEIPTGELYGIAVNPANEDLLAAVNGALAAMVADGTYQTIYDGWFDKPEGSINYVPELPQAEAPWPEKIVFGFVPSQDQEELQDDVDTFAAVLSDALGIEVWVLGRLISVRLRLPAMCWLRRRSLTSLCRWRSRSGSVRVLITVSGLPMIRRFVLSLRLRVRLRIWIRRLVSGWRLVSRRFWVRRIRLLSRSVTTVMTLVMRRCLRGLPVRRL